MFLADLLYNKLLELRPLVDAAGTGRLYSVSSLYFFNWNILNVLSLLLETLCIKPVTTDFKPSQREIERWLRGEEEEEEGGGGSQVCRWLLETLENVLKMTVNVPKSVPSRREERRGGVLSLSLADS